jgi:hypothetical protein
MAPNVGPDSRQRWNQERRSQPQLGTSDAATQNTQQRVRRYLAAQNYINYKKGQDGRSGNLRVRRFQVTLRQSTLT